MKAGNVIMKLESNTIVMRQFEGLELLVIGWSRELSISVYRFSIGVIGTD